MRGIESTYRETEGIVVKLCTQYRTALERMGLTWDEIVSVAQGGFMKAFQKYDETKGGFTTYLYQKVERALQDEYYKPKKRPVLFDGSELKMVTPVPDFEFNDWRDTLSEDARYAVNVLFYRKLPASMEAFLEERKKEDQHDVLRNALREYLTHDCKWGAKRVSLCFAEIRHRLEHKEI